MSRTEDHNREKKAYEKGYLAGKYGDPIEACPYRAANTQLWWQNGWRVGRRHRRKKAK